MNRGYIKFWRKAQDSASWNRGLMYQGLIINLLSRAAWKKSSYQGRDILPGQFGAVMSHLAESLGVPRSTLQRMVAHLEADDFLKVENMGNRFVMITIVNWHIYQESEKEAWATDGQLTVNQRAAGGQPSYKEEEVKKEEVRIKYTPLTPHGGEGAGEVASASACGEEDEPKPKRTRFVPPGADDVQAYCDERRNGVNGQEFCDFYSSKGWKVGNTPMKDWRAAVRTWERGRTGGGARASPAPMKSFAERRADEIEADFLAGRI